MKVNEMKLSVLISDYMINAKDVNNYIFSIEHQMWEELINSYIKIFGIKTVLFACKWARATEDVITTDAISYEGDLCNITASSLTDVYQGEGIDCVRVAYVILMSIWEYAGILPYPSSTIEHMIDNMDSIKITELMPMPLPYE